MDAIGIDLESIVPPLNGISLLEEPATLIPPDHTSFPDHTILISLSGVQRNHFKELLAAHELPHFSSIIDTGRFVDINILHCVFRATKEGTIYNNNIGNEVRADEVSGIASLLTGVGPEMHGNYSKFRMNIIPKGQTIFEALENMYALYIYFLAEEEHNPVNYGGIFYYAQNVIDTFEINIPSGNFMDKIRESLNIGRIMSTFGFIHFSTPHWAGHMHGENSIEYDNAIIECDTRVGILLDIIDQLDLDVNIYITASHGFDEQSPDFPITAVSRQGHDHFTGTQVFLLTNDNRVIRGGSIYNIQPALLSLYNLPIHYFQESLYTKKKTW